MLSLSATPKLALVSAPSKSLFTTPARSFFKRKPKVDITEISSDDIPVNQLLASNNKWEMVYEGFLHAGIRRLKVVRFKSLSRALI